MLVRDILLKRKYDHNHNPVTEPEIESEPLPPILETGVRVLVRLAITKITGGLL